MYPHVIKDLFLFARMCEAVHFELTWPLLLSFVHVGEANLRTVFQ